MKNKTKSIKKIIVFVIFLILLATVVSSGVYLFLKENQRRDNISENTYIGVLEDGTYYIAKAKKNIRFQISDLDTNTYKLTDQNNNIVESKVIEQGNKKLIQANELYKEGETYTLELTETSFSEKKLKEAKKIIFKIEEKEKANYKLNEKVKVIENEVQLQENGEEKTIQIPNTTIEKDDIILIKDINNENNYKNAFKINNVENGIATVSEPEVAEIFDEFDLYNEEKVNFENLEIDKDFKDRVELAVKKSALYQFLINESYAADNVGVEAKIDVNGEQITIELLITAKANGQEFLGVKALTNHDLELKFIINLSCDMIVDMQKNTGLNLDIALKQGFEFEIKLESNSTILEGVGELSDDQYLKSIQEIVAKLEGANEDKTQGKMRIGAIEVPTGITGVNAYIDVYFQTELALRINFTYNQKIEVIDHAGLIINKDTTMPYFNTEVPKSDIEMSAYGKANIRIGPGFDVGVSIISKDLAHVGIGIEGGLYGDLFATMNTTYTTENSELNEKFVGELETGIYFKPKFSAGINIFFLKANYSKGLDEIKIPFLEIKKEWQTSISDGEKLNKPTNNSNNNGSSQGNGTSNNGMTTDSSILMSNKDIVAKYKEYVTSKKYLADVGDSWQDSTKKYCIYDINQDGIVELLIMADTYLNDSEWKTTSIYTYDTAKGKIVFVNSIGGYWEIQYAPEDKAIVCEPVRHFKDAGILSYSQLENNKLAEIKSIGWYEEGKYFIETKKNRLKDVSFEEYQKELKKIANFKFGGMEMFD